MKKNEDVHPFMVLIFKLLTWFQETTIKQEKIDFYYFFTKLHFRLYYGKNLVKEAVKESREFQNAQRRHICMLMTYIKADRKLSGPTLHYEVMAAISFQKNLLLEARL